MKWMKTNCQGKKGFKLFPEEQTCSQRKQGLNCPEEQPYSKRKKKKFSLKTQLLFREKIIYPRNNELPLRKCPSSLGKHMV